MDDRIEDDEREALAGLSSVPPPRKSHSYSQQLRAGSDQKRFQLRKHSLDEDQIPKVMEGYYDSSDDDFLPYSTTSAIGGEEFLSQRLDQNLCMDSGGGLDDSRQSQALAEFVGSGGSTGFFKVPIRASVHPGRPTCLELRPHPLRETQIGKFLRNIVCTETQLWAGQECGVRFWNFENAYEAGSGLGGRVRRGDEDAAPFYESANTSPTMCLIVDNGNRLVWSGHKDGKIRSWKMDQSLDEMPFKEGLSWQAHRGPVLAMTITSYGMLSFSQEKSKEAC